MYTYSQTLVQRPHPLSRRISQGMSENLRTKSGEGWRVSNCPHLPPPRADAVARVNSLAIVSSFITVCSGLFLLYRRNADWNVIRSDKCSEAGGSQEVTAGHSCNNCIQQAADSKLGLCYPIHLHAPHHNCIQHGGDSKLGVCYSIHLHAHQACNEWAVPVAVWQLCDLLYTCYLLQCLFQAPFLGGGNYPQAHNPPKWLPNCVL